MSWHTSGLLIHADHSRDVPGLLEKLGIEDAEPSGEEMSFEDATSVDMDGLAVACVDGWTCLFSSFAILLIEDKAVAKLSKEADVFSMILEGSTGAAGFEWWTKGKKVRHRMVVEGDVTVDEGELLPAEKSVFAKKKDDEQRVLMLMEKLTVTFDVLADTRFTVFGCDGDFEGLLDE